MRTWLVMSMATWVVATSGPALAQWGQMAPPPPRENPQFAHTQAELEAFVAKWLAGYVGAPKRTGTLETFAPIEVRLLRGRCYMMSLQLAPGAQFSPHAKRGISFVYQPVGAGTQINGGPGIHGPGGLGSAGCPQASGLYTFDIQAHWGSAMDKSKIHDLGTGGYTLQLFSKPVSDQKLGEQAADTRRQIAESEQFKRDSIRNTCVRCSQEKDECLEGRRRPFSGSCVSEFRSCLSRGSVYNQADCFGR